MSLGLKGNYLGNTVRILTEIYLLGVTGAQIGKEGNPFDRRLCRGLVSSVNYL